MFLTCPRANLDSGFAQLLVLGALATVSGLLTLGLVAATESSMTSASLERLVRTQTAASAGFYRMLHAIQSPADQLETEALAGPVVVQVSDQPLELAIAGEGGKVDVMLADISLLRRLLENAGASSAETAGVLNSVTEMRELGDSAGALETVRAALAVSGPMDQIDATITRFGAAGIDLAYASEPVLRAIPDLDPADAVRIAATAPADRAQFAQLSRYFVGNSRRFTIIARIEWAPGQVSEHRLPIEISTSGRPILLGGVY